MGVDVGEVGVDVAGEVALELGRRLFVEEPAAVDGGDSVGHERALGVGRPGERRRARRRVAHGGQQRAALLGEVLGDGGALDDLDAVVVDEQRRLAVAAPLERVLAALAVDAAEVLELVAGRGQLAGLAQLLEQPDDADRALGGD